MGSFACFHEELPFFTKVGILREVYQIAGKKCICWNIDGMGGIKGQRREMSNPVRLIFLLQVNIQIPRMNLDNFKMKYTFTRPHRTETHLHCGGVWCSKWMANGYATEMLEEAELNWHSRRWLTLHCSCIGSVSIQQRDHSLIEWVEKLWWYSSNTPILCWYPG